MLDKLERELVDALLGYARLDLATEVPPAVEHNRARAREIIAAVANIYGATAKTSYFETSLLRYEHYFAVAQEFDPGARILEIGSAPGHVSVGLSLLGFELKCLNLNSLYRTGYPSQEWLDRLDVIEHDFEKAPLPYADGSFDAVFFTEVLEHIAIKPAVDVLRDIHRVCCVGGALVLSTPNVCNISNVAALLGGANVFWRPEQFYGSLDRHNREFTPAEVRDTVREAGFSIRQMYGFNCHSNWRGGGNEFTYRVVGEVGDEHPLLLNTIMVVAQA